nr:MAG TPA: hypothetical protein [Caudoviricetes sp.]DAP83632.1 MAG TPA: hypothetical protein [Caudoviricetes sp.]
MICRLISSCYRKAFCPYFCIITMQSSVPFYHGFCIRTVR